MIKRTVEKVLSWIGNILHLLYLIFIALMVSMMGNKDFKNQMIDNTQSSNQGVTSGELNHSYNLISGMGSGFLIFFIVLLILAIIATILISKKPKIAGVILLIIGILAIITSSFLAGVLWIIAGIMLLVRKSKNDKYDYHDNYHDDVNNNHYKDNQYEENDRSTHDGHYDDVEHEYTRRKDHYDNVEHDNSRRDNHYDDVEHEREYSRTRDHKHSDFIDEEKRHRKHEKDDDPFKY